MNLPVLTLLLLAVGSAGWSAAEVGVAPGEQPRWAGTGTRTASVVPVEQHPCGVGNRTRVALRAPRIEPAGMAAADRARLEQAVVEEWRDRMTAAGVPRDLLDRTLRMPNRVYELSNHEMERTGCVAV
jgi:hypothetical protein